MTSRMAPGGRQTAVHQTRQEFSGYIGLTLLAAEGLAELVEVLHRAVHPPLPGEWGSVSASSRADSLRLFWHQTWAKPMK